MSITRVRPVEPDERVRGLERRVAELEARMEWLFRATGYGSANFAHPVGPPVTASADGSARVSREVLELIRRDKKIAAIKQYRQENGVGLAEAKNVIDSL